ncbi:diguanylate cyclase domain-containing protein [Geodermatophilus sp. URMC 64]
MSTAPRPGQSGDDARGGTRLPRGVRWTLLVGLLGLAAAVPFSAPDGTGMQWDELVLTGVAASSAWALFRRTRTMSGAAARPWRVMGAAASLFAVAQLLAGAFPGPEFDGFGVDDVLLFLGATAPLVTCAMLVRRVRRTRWGALAVDGAMVTTALLVVTEVLRTPLVNPVGAPEDLRSLVLTYGGYAAAALGVGTALCTVSTAALRRSVTTMVLAVALQAAAAFCEAMAIVAPSPLWTAGSDLTVALALQATVLAALCAPDTYDDRSARASAARVSPVGLVLLVVAVLTLPAAFALSVLQHEPLSRGAELGVAGVFSLLAVRLVLRIREDGEVTEHLVRSEEEFRELVESSSDGVAIVDDELRLLFVSPAARAMLGLAGEAEDVPLAELVHAEDRELVRTALLRPDGPELHVRVGDRELEATSSERPGSRRVLHLRDVTTRRRRERELERMAYTDHLTALPNRAHLFEELADDSTAERCLLVLDLDGFKAVNDVAGHEAGDQLLVEMARRLSTVIREDDLVARLGGDEFAVLVSGTLDESVEVAQRVVDALALPHRTGERSFAVGASVGVARIGVAGGQVAFREADTALRAAKRAGKGCVRVAGESAVALDERLDLAAALAAGELELRYDAVTALDGRVAQVQARAVWLHPELGRIDGQDLWALAERQGLLLEVQRWGIRRASREIAAMDGDVGLVLRLPASQLPGEVVITEIAAALDAAGLAPSRLTLTLTEETLLTSPAGLVPALETVRRSGVRLCLTGYGMGHSLFALLARVPLDAVRVDVATLAVRDDLPRALRVLAAIVRTTDAFGLTAVADGVDTVDARDGALAAGAQFVAGRVAPSDLTSAEVAALLATPALLP